MHRDRDTTGPPQEGPWSRSRTGHVLRPPRRQLRSLWASPLTVRSLNSSRPLATTAQDRRGIARALGRGRRRGEQRTLNVHHTLHTPLSTCTPLRPSPAARSRSPDQAIDIRDAPAHSGARAHSASSGTPTPRLPFQRVKSIWRESCAART